jgi:hypothetical protein
MAQHARDAYKLIEELESAGFPANGPTMLAAKRLRMQLLTTKGDLERELGRLVLHCQRCDRTVHWVPGVGPEPGHARPFARAEVVPR